MIIGAQEVIVYVLVERIVEVVYPSAGASVASDFPV